MYTFLLVLLVIDCFVLVAAILLQSGSGSGLASSFGGMSSSTDALFGTRQAGTLLTRTSWWAGGIFLFLAFVLSLMSARTSAPKSVLDQTFAPTPGAPAATAPATPPGSQTPAGVPLTPAAPAQGQQQTPAPAPKK